MARFDDLDLARLLEPPLTTVAAHGAALGALAFAFETLAARMAGLRVARRAARARGADGPRLGRPAAHSGVNAR